MNGINRQNTDLQLLASFIETELSKVEMEVIKNNLKQSGGADYYKMRIIDYPFPASMLRDPENPLLGNREYRKRLIDAVNVPNQLILSFRESASYKIRSKSDREGMFVKVPGKLLGLIPWIWYHQELHSSRGVSIEIPFGPDEQTAKLKLPYLSYGIDLSNQFDLTKLVTKERTYHDWPKVTMLPGITISRDAYAEEVAGILWLMQKVLSCS